MERMSSSEFVDWIAFYELEKRDEKRAAEKAKRESR